MYHCHDTIILTEKDKEWIQHHKLIQKSKNTQQYWHWSLLLTPLEGHWRLKWMKKWIGYYFGGTHIFSSDAHQRRVIFECSLRGFSRANTYLVHTEEVCLARDLLLLKNWLHLIEVEEVFKSHTKWHCSFINTDNT